MEQPHVLWIDNFSKFISRSIPTADKGVFSSCLWTGVSLFKLPDGVGDAISDEIKLDGDERVVPAMPSDILMYQEGVVAAVNHVLSLGPKYSDNAAVCKYNVCTVPLKVDTHIYHDVAADVNSYNMSHLRAVDLIEHNIGSNRGLLTILDTICHERNIHGDVPCTRYTTFNVDENIFWRILKVRNSNPCVLHYINYVSNCFVSKRNQNLLCKFLVGCTLKKIFEKDFGLCVSCFNDSCVQVMYDRSEGGKRLRTYVGCSLAWWHSYKWATKRILIVYANDFIAPLFHYLWPARQFDPMKCSHTSATTILSYIRLAYPGFKNSLQEQLANPIITVRQRTILQNLQHLCEFFIPVVCIFWCMVD